jgi:GT2 family glycosyltransferase
MMQKTDLSIIVLSYNTKDLLRLCLSSINKAEKANINIQIIVVDNASSDGSAGLVKKEFPWVELIESKKNSGYSAGNNLGVSKSDGEYILFLNSDVEIKKNALTEILDFIKNEKSVGAVTPKVDLFTGGMDPDCHRGFPTPWASLTYFSGLEALFPKTKLFGSYHLGYMNLNKVHEIDAGFGTFMLIRKEILEEVGNWDESYFFYGEDLDYFYRIKKSGWKVIFYPRVLALHHKGASSGLRKESIAVSKADKKTKIKTAQASIAAMELFYNKFYKDKYNPLITYCVLLGIKIKGFFRILKFLLFS